MMVHVANPRWACATAHEAVKSDAKDTRCLHRAGGAAHRAQALRCVLSETAVRQQLLRGRICHPEAKAVHQPAGLPWLDLARAPSAASAELRAPHALPVVYEISTYQEPSAERWTPWVLLHLEADAFRARNAAPAHHAPAHAAHVAQ
jgi:hypothetical protein